MSCANMCPEGILRVCQAFNARPEGATSSQPRASERSERHPGLDRWFPIRPRRGQKQRQRCSNRTNGALNYTGWAFKSNEPGIQIERTGRSFMPGGRLNRTNGTFIYAGWAFKSNDNSLLSLLLPPPGAYRKPICLTQGVARYARLPWAGSLLPLRGAR